WVRGDLAVQLLKKDRATALRLADGIQDGLPRAITYTRLASIEFKAHPKTAHGWVEKAGELLAAEAGDPLEGGQRLGAAVYLLCLADQMAYPDMASLTAVAMTARDPVPMGPHVEQTRRAALLRLAIGVGCVAPAAGRALLEAVGPPPEKSTEDD